MTRRLLWVAMLLGWILALPLRAQDPPSPNLPPDVRARLEAMEASLSEVTDLKASFQKQKFTPLLRKPLITKGRLLARGGIMRWDTLGANPSHTLIGGGEVRILYPDQKRMEIYPLDGRFGEFLTSPMPKISSLLERFEVNYVPPAGGDAPADGPVTLRLTPRDEETRARLESLTVTIDTRSRYMRELQIEQPGGERTVYLFDGVEINPGLPDDALDLKVLKDIEVVRPYGNGSDE